MVQQALLAEFEPFRGETLNSSLEAVRGLEARTVEGMKLIVYKLPTEFTQAARKLEEEIRRSRTSSAPRSWRSRWRHERGAGRRSRAERECGEFEDGPITHR